MPKNNDERMIRTLELFKKKAVRHLLTAKSNFDFADVSKKVKRRKMRVKSMTRNQCR